MSNLEITDEVLLAELKKRFEEKKKAIDDFQSLTAQLQEVNDKLTQSESLKSHFIANINNEIVNPFASVLGLSRSIMDSKSNDWERVHRLAKLIFTEAFQLDFQLKNIFAAAEIEAGRVYPQLSNIDVKHIILGIMSDFDSDLKAKKITYDIELDVETGDDQTFYFTADSEKLRLILANLINNSIKFSKGANIEIRIKHNNKDKNLIVSIKDYGIGISEHNQKIIFDRFTRLDTGINSINRGHGLGLSVVKAFLELFNGDIKIESQKGKGSTFTITIPEQQSDDEVTDFSSEGNEVFFGDGNDELF